MTWRKILLWLPALMIVPAIIYLLLGGQPDTWLILLVFGALALGALSVANESKD